MKRRPVVPPPQRPLVSRLRVHANKSADCDCVRCEAAEEISRLRDEIRDAYEQIGILLRETGKP